MFNGLLEQEICWSELLERFSYIARGGVGCAVEQGAEMRRCEVELETAFACAIAEVGAGVDGALLGAWKMLVQVWSIAGVVVEMWKGKIE